MHGEKCLTPLLPRGRGTVAAKGRFCLRYELQSIALDSRLRGNDEQIPHPL